MFMVLSSWQSHCDSSPGSFDECRMALDLCPLHSQILDPPLTWAAECVIRRMSNVLIYDCLRPGFHKMQDTHATQWSCVKSLRTQRNVTHARLVLAYNGQFGTLRGLRCVILIILHNVTHARSQISPTQRKRWTHVLIVRRKNATCDQWHHCLLLSRDVVYIIMATVLSWRLLCSAVVSRLFTATFETALLL